MENFKNNPIWQVIQCVEKGGNVVNRASRYKAAKIEFDILAGKINIQSNTAMKHLETFLSAFKNSQDQAAKKQLESAKHAFKTHVEPHYQREQEENKKKTAKERGNSQPDESIPNTTERQDVETVARRFRDIYDTVWNDAHDELDKFMVSSVKEIAILLMEILERAFKFCKEEAERQILGAQLVIEDIVQNGKITKTGKIQPSTNHASSPHDLLRQYRYLNGHLSEPRLVKEFLDAHVKPFCNKNKLKPDSAVKNYAISCVKITWLLCTEDPPVRMVTGKEGDDFDEHLYTTVTKKGKKIDYVVWPALKNCENGPILSQGAAQCK